MLHKCLMFTVLLLCAAASFAANDTQFVIPAAGTGPGAQGSDWKSEITLHNAGADAIGLQLSFHNEDGQAGIAAVTVPARQTIALPDVVAETFGHHDRTTGAIVITADPVSAAKLAVSSRTYNTTAAGEFGQDIPALPVSAALGPGDAGVIAGPSRASEHRFNFGIYTLENASIEWKLLRRDSSVAQTVSREYRPQIQEQYSNGVLTLFNVAPEDNDVIHARVLSGRIFAYGSWVHDRTGDPTYSPANRVHENFLVQLVGVDHDENGTVDYFDADNDRVLDQPVAIAGGRFGAFIRLVGRDPEGRPVTYRLMNHPGEAQLMDPSGQVFLYPGMFPAGTTDLLIVRASDGIEEVEFRIPLVYF